MEQPVNKLGLIKKRPLIQFEDEFVVEGQIQSPIKKSMLTIEKEKMIINSVLQHETNISGDEMLNFLLLHELLFLKMIKEVKKMTIYFAFDKVDQDKLIFMCRPDGKNFINGTEITYEKAESLVGLYSKQFRPVYEFDKDKRKIINELNKWEIGRNYGFNEESTKHIQFINSICRTFSQSPLWWCNIVFPDDKVFTFLFMTSISSDGHTLVHLMINFFRAEAVYVENESKSHAISMIDAKFIASHHIDGVHECNDVDLLIEMSTLGRTSLFNKIIRPTQYVEETDKRGKKTQKQVQKQEELITLHPEDNETFDYTLLDEEEEGEGEGELEDIGEEEDNETGDYLDEAAKNFVNVPPEEVPFNRKELISEIDILNLMAAYPENTKKMKEYGNSTNHPIIPIQKAPYDIRESQFQENIVIISLVSGTIVINRLDIEGDIWFDFLTRSGGFMNNVFYDEQSKSLMIHSINALELYILFLKDKIETVKKTIKKTSHDEVKGKKDKELKSLKKSLQYYNLEYSKKYDYTGDENQLKELERINNEQDALGKIRKISEQEISEFMRLKGIDEENLIIPIPLIDIHEIIIHEDADGMIIHINRNEEHSILLDPIDEEEQVEEKSEVTLKKKKKAPTVVNKDNIIRYDESITTTSFLESLMEQIKINNKMKFHLFYVVDSNTANHVSLIVGVRKSTIIRFVARINDDVSSPFNSSLIFRNARYANFDEKMTEFFLLYFKKKPLIDSQDGKLFEIVKRIAAFTGYVHENEELKMVDAADVRMTKHSIGNELKKKNPAIEGVSDEVKKTVEIITTNNNDIIRYDEIIHDKPTMEKIFEQIGGIQNLQFSLVFIRNQFGREPIIVATKQQKTIRFIGRINDHISPFNSSFIFHNLRTKNFDSKLTDFILLFFEKQRVNYTRSANLFKLLKGALKTTGYIREGEELELVEESESKKMRDVKLQSFVHKDAKTAENQVMLHEISQKIEVSNTLQYSETKPVVALDQNEDQEMTNLLVAFHDFKKWKDALALTDFKEKLYNISCNISSNKLGNGKYDLNISTEKIILAFINASISNFDFSLLNNAKVEDITIDLKNSIPFAIITLEKKDGAIFRQIDIEVSSFDNIRYMFYNSDQERNSVLCPNLKNLSSYFTNAGDIQREITKQRIDDKEEEWSRWSSTLLTEKIRKLYVGKLVKLRYGVDVENKALPIYIEDEKNRRLFVFENVNLFESKYFDKLIHIQEITIGRKKGLYIIFIKSEELGMIKLEASSITKRITSNQYTQQLRIAIYDENKGMLNDINFIITSGNSCIPENTVPIPTPIIIEPAPSSKPLPPIINLSIPVSIPIPVEPETMIIEEEDSEITKKYNHLFSSDIIRQTIYDKIIEPDLNDSGDFVVRVFGGKKIFTFKVVNAKIPFNIPSDEEEMKISSIGFHGVEMRICVKVTNHLQSLSRIYHIESFSCIEYRESLSDSWKNIFNIDVKSPVLLPIPPTAVPYIPAMKIVFEEPSPANVKGAEELQNEWQLFFSRIGNVLLHNDRLSFFHDVSSKSVIISPKNYLSLKVAIKNVQDIFSYQDENVRNITGKTMNVNVERVNILYSEEKQRHIVRFITVEDQFNIEIYGKNLEIDFYYDTVKMDAETILKTIVEKEGPIELNPFMPIYKAIHLNWKKSKNHHSLNIASTIYFSYYTNPFRVKMIYFEHFFVFVSSHGTVAFYTTPPENIQVKRSELLVNDDVRVAFIKQLRKWMILNDDDNRYNFIITEEMFNNKNIIPNLMSMSVQQIQSQKSTTLSFIQNILSNPMYRKTLLRIKSELYGRQYSLFYAEYSSNIIFVCTNIPYQYAMVTPDINSSYQFIHPSVMKEVINDVFSNTKSYSITLGEKGLQMINYFVHEYIQYLPPSDVLIPF